MKKLTKLLFAGFLALAIVPAAFASLHSSKEVIETKADVSEEEWDVYSFSSFKTALESPTITTINIKQDLVGERSTISYLDVGGAQKKQVSGIQQAYNTRKTINMFDGAKVVFSQNPEDKLISDANLVISLIVIPYGSSLTIKGNGTLGFGALAQSNRNSLICNYGSLSLESDDVTLSAEAVFKTTVKTIENYGRFHIYGGKIVDSGALDKISYGVYNGAGSYFQSYRSQIINQYLCSDEYSRDTRDYSLYFMDTDTSKPLSADIIRGSFDRVVAASQNPMQYLDPDSKAYDTKGNEVTTAIKFNQKITIGPEQILFTKQPVGGTAKIESSLEVSFALKGTPDQVKLFRVRHGGDISYDGVEGFSIDFEHGKVVVPYSNKAGNEVEFYLSAVVIFHKDTSPELIPYNSNKFTVKWTEFNIKFDKGEGSGSMEPMTSDSNKFTLPECGFIAPSGKEFYGWEYNGNIYYPYYDITLKDDAVVKAIYRDITYEFFKQPTSSTQVLGKGASTKFEASFGKARIAVKEKIDDNFVFVDNLSSFHLLNQYWTKDSPNSVGIHTYRLDIMVGDELKVSSDLFTMEWTADDLPEHNVYFNAGDGTGSMDTVKVNTGTEYSLPDSEFEAPDDMVFIGWAINDPTDSPVDVGTVITVPTDTTLYAIYDIGATISFDGAGADGAMENIEHIYGSYIIPECEFETPLGSSFVCWNDGGKNYYPGDKVFVYGDLWLTAVWKDNYYKITFNANGGSGEMASAEISGSLQYTLPDCDFTEPSEHYYFAGWAFDGPNGQIYMSESQLPVLEEDVVLYAIWALKEYTVTYNAGTAASAENVDINETVDALTTIELKNGSFVFEAPEGKHFKEWAVNTASGMKLNSEFEYQVVGNVTFIAIWEDNANIDDASDGVDTEGMEEDLEGQKYTVTFNANGGTGTMEAVSNISGQYTLPACGFTAPNGKEFAGWKVNNAGDLLQAGAQINVTANIELVAQWKDSETPVEPTEPDTPAKKKSGCGGSIAAASAIISVVALAGVGLFFIRRKEK